MVKSVRSAARGGRPAEGYGKLRPERQPFHGYFFKILTRQGKPRPR